VKQTIKGTIKTIRKNAPIRNSTICPPVKYSTLGSGCHTCIDPRSEDGIVSKANTLIVVRRSFEYDSKIRVARTGNAEWDDVYENKFFQHKL